LPNHTNGYTTQHDDNRESAISAIPVVWSEAYLRCGALTTLGENDMAAKKAAKKPAKKAAKKKAAKKKK
jgi:hypothetical protein